MKKIWISLFISLFVTCSVYGCNLVKNKPIINSDGTVDYDFSKQSQAKASKILYRYILKDLNKTSKEAKDFANITPKAVSAFEIDLNDDGKKEIIGVVFSTYYWGTAGYSLFILEKKNDNYQNLAYILSFEPLKNLRISNKKNNDYKDIQYYGSSAYNFASFTAKFNKSEYVNMEQIKLLEEYLKNFSHYDVSEIMDIKE